MNQELTNNPFNPLTSPKVSMRSKSLWPAQSGSFHGLSVKSKSPKRSITGPLSPSVMVCSAREFLAQPKITNVCAANING